MTKEYPEIVKNGLVYFDTWPFGQVTLAAFNPDLAAQFTQERSYPKAQTVRTELEPLTGLKDLSSMEGEEWKTWRSIFNPGFSAKNLTALVPAFLEEIQVLKERLVKAAESGTVIRMEETIQRATVDVIFRAAL
jgi:cytochrome P450